MGATDKVWWCDRGWQPLKFGFCPSKKAWKREMKRLGIDEPFPKTDGRCTVATNRTTGNAVALVVINAKKAKTLKMVEVIGLLVHEATHVWQEVKCAMGEKEPSVEFEAYAMQAIAQELVHAYQQTIGFGDR